MASGTRMATQPTTQVSAKPTAPPRLPLPWLLTGLATGILLWLCYFPVGWGFLGWVALVPCLVLVRLPASGKNLFWGAYLGATLFFFPVLQWMRVADWRMYGTWLMLATYCSFYLPMALWMLRRLDQKTPLPLVVTLPVVWVGLEFVRSFMLTGFAWYYLGHTQHRFLELIQMADLGGVYLISVLVAAVNAWVFEVAWHFTAVRQFMGVTDKSRTASNAALTWQGSVIVALIIAAVTYGNYRLGQDRFDGGPRLALLQGNLDQRLRNAATAAEGGDARATVLHNYEALSQKAVLPTPRADMVVWPETSFPYYWVDLPEDMNSVPADERNYANDVRERVRIMGEHLKTHVLLGLNSSVWESSKEPTSYNSALFLNPRGLPMGRYDKIHRVPFGEFLPFEDTLPLMKWLSPYPFKYGIEIGKKQTRFNLNGFTFGVLICYEDTDPFLARRFGVANEDGPPVDFLVNISNDGWFDGTSEHEEHLAICRFRAIECRKPVARAVNMGISAVIDSNGRVQAPEKVPQMPDVNFWLVRERMGKMADLPVSEWSQYKKVEGILYAGMPIDHRVSLYSMWGDWVPGMCWTLVVVGLAWGWWRGRGTRSALAKASG